MQCLLCGRKLIKEYCILSSIELLVRRPLGFILIPHLHSGDSASVHRSMRLFYKKILDSITTRAKTVANPADQMLKKSEAMASTTATPTVTSTATPSGNWAKLQKVSSAKSIYTL